MSERGGRRRKTRPRTRGKSGKKASTAITCRLIQWREGITDPEGKPICPECFAPAKSVLGVFGFECWAHE